MNEPVSIRLPEEVKARADRLIPYLRRDYPNLSNITRQNVLREAVFRGLSDLEYKSKLKED